MRAILAVRISHSDADRRVRAVDRGMRRWIVGIGLAAFAWGLAAPAEAQFVWPRRQDHVSEPGLYTEDPFIVKYRAEFFAVFRGDVARFERAFAEIRAMVEKDPEDARARVWLGNGQTVAAGLRFARGEREGLAEALAESRRNLDRAVAKRPDDPNIYMMRAATLYVQGMFAPPEAMPRSAWETLRDDCLRFIAYVGDRMPRASVHLRGETYGELGVAYLRLGDRKRAADAFRRVIELCPGTPYEDRARRELRDLGEPEPPKAEPPKTAPAAG